MVKSAKITNRFEVVAHSHEGATARQRCGGREKEYLRVRMARCS